MFFGIWIVKNVILKIKAFNKLRRTRVSLIGLLRNVNISMPFERERS